MVCAVGRFQATMFSSSPHIQYDINGVSGGCQQRYTVVANATASQPSCQNVTAPAALSVSAKVPTGALPLFGYIDQVSSTLPQISTISGIVLLLVQDFISYPPIWEPSFHFDGKPL